jgi:hypothetical protein
LTNYVILMVGLKKRLMMVDGTNIKLWLRDGYSIRMVGGVIAHVVGPERPDQAQANFPPIRSRMACSAG